MKKAFIAVNFAGLIWFIVCIDNNHAEQTRAQYHPVCEQAHDILYPGAEH